MGLRAQVEISLVVSSRLLLCYRSGLARIVFVLDLEGFCYESIIIIWYQILHCCFLLLCFHCVVILLGARTSPLGIFLPCTALGGIKAKDVTEHVDRSPKLM